MGLARFGEVLREFSAAQRMEGTKESPFWGEGLSSSFLSLTVRPGHCLGEGLGPAEWLTPDIC